MQLKIGDTAPDFTLYNSDKKAVTLSSLRGKSVVLLFFPLAFTSTCTQELCSVRDDISNYEGLDAIVFGISTDTPHTLKAYKASESYNFDLLSDFNKEVSLAYGSQYETFSVGLKGVSKRSAFVIDKEGILRYIEVLENADLIPDLLKVKEVLASI